MTRPTSTAVGAFLLLTTLALGPHIWLDWIAYNDANTRAQVTELDNLSLVKIVYPILKVSPTLIGALLAVLLCLPLGSSNRGIATALPALILASPIAWPHYLPTALLGTRSRTLLAFSGVATGGLVLTLFIGAPGSIEKIFAYAATSSAILVWLDRVRDGYRYSDRRGRPRRSCPLNAPPVRARNGCPATGVGLRVDSRSASPLQERTDAALPAMRY